MIDSQVYPARQGYNLLAKYYSAWYWYPFWRSNEGPLIREWLSGVSGIGIDAGCGNAPYLLDYVETNKDLKFLIDFSEGMLEQAEIRLDKATKINPNFRNRVSLLQADIALIPLKNGAADFLLCSRVLSNIRNIDTVLREFSRVLKPLGRLLITDIHPQHVYEYTGINTENGRVNIETFKHQVVEVINSANSAGFQLEQHQEFNLLNLKKTPDPKQFEKLYSNPRNSIFFLLSFKKA